MSSAMSSARTLAQPPTPNPAKQQATVPIEVMEVTGAPGESPTTETKPLSFIRYKALNTYRRLFSLVFLGNLAAFVFVAVKGASPTILIDAVAANLLASGLARQPLMVNLLFRALCLIPHSAPLRLRRLACKIFHLGGVHSGCGVAAFVWYVGFVAIYTQQYVPSPVNTAALVIAYAVLALLTFMIVVAYPSFRIKWHDWFELIHRFSSWLTIALVWALVLTVAAGSDQGMGMFLITSPAFWMLLISTLAIIHPWATLRRVEVIPEPLSDHAIRLHFNHTSIVFGQGMSVSKHPLRDWHSFAAFTDKYDNPETQFSMLVSKAGDWTSSVISEPPRYLWKRGVPVYGFGYVMKVFPRIILVTTGSGIGPCLSFIEDENRPAMRVIWQTRDPDATYGPRVLDLVRKLDPNPEIIRTSKQGGRVDLLPIAIRLYKEFNAEAIGVVSNMKLTKQLVYDLERHGIPAYGPIFDS
ncbi:integral membrane protein TmpA [Apiospora arundinis]